MVRDFSKEKPADLKPGRLIETTGTCKYCKNLVTIKADPDATEEEKDSIAPARIQKTRGILKPLSACLQTRSTRGTAQCPRMHEGR